MGAAHVVALAEGLLHHLPVGPHHLADVALDVAALHVPPGEVLRQPTEELLQGHAVGIRVDEHEPSPGADLDLRQRPLAVVDVLEVPPRRHMAEGAVQLPREAVERAAHLAATPADVFQLPPAVEAGVVERLDLAGGRAHDDEGQVGDVVDDVAADVLDLLLTAGELPHALPQAFHLALVPVPRRIPRVGDVLVAEVLRAFQAQHLGHRLGVRVEQLLVGDPAGSCLAGSGGVGHGGPSESY